MIKCSVALSSNWLTISVSTHPRAHVPRQLGHALQFHHLGTTAAASQVGSHSANRGNGSNEQQTMLSLVDVGREQS